MRWGGGEEEGTRAGTGQETSEGKAETRTPRERKVVGLGRVTWLETASWSSSP